jgi:thiol:disulfide interchange protein DsbD
VAVKLGYRNVYRDPYGFPKWQEHGLPISSAPAGLASSTMAPARQPDDRSLQGWAMLWTLLGVFAGGLALNLTPCVYPMIPITVSFFGGRASEQRPTHARLVLHGICYLMGLALTNSILGVVAALTSSLMGALLQSPFVLAAIAAILVFFATSLFGLWELRLPSALTQMAGRSYTGYFGSLFMGLTLGVVAAPCIGPFVLGLLTWVAGIGSAWLGFLVFFVLSLGLGLPLFVLALFSGQLQRLPRAGGWMEWVRKLMGWVLVGMAAYFIRPVLPPGFKVFLPAVIALAAGIHLGWLDRNRAAFRAFEWLKTLVAVACLVLAAYWVTSWALKGPGVDWQSYSDQLIEASASQGKPVIIDFYAAWCTPCRELDEVTFHHPGVVQLSKNRFTMIKVDVTQGGDPLHERLLAQYGVKGVPTVVFLDSSGKERKDLRLVDFLPPEPFLGRMAQAKQVENP